MSRSDEAREVLRELLHEALGNGRGGNGHRETAPAAGGTPPAPAPPAAGGTPQVPAPPVAAVFRPSTWHAPPAPGEVIGDRPRPSLPPSMPGFTPPASADVIADRRTARGDVMGDRQPPSSPPSMPGFSPPGRPPPTGAGGPRAVRADGPSPRAAVEQVTLDSDADLDRFVRSLLARFESPRDRAAIKAGRVRFALRRATAAPRAAATPAAPATLRIERGAVTERTIKEAAAAGARVVLAPAAVVTPLAKEKARALGVEIERERPC
jgi:hypothetical protein